jgi:replication factor A1
MVKIAELQPGQGSVEVEAVIKELEETKTFNKYGKELRLRSAVIEDDSGATKLTLWNDDVDKFGVGERIKVVNGYVNEFQGEKQLTSGKFGKIEKVEGSVDDASIPSDSSSMMEKPEEAFGVGATSEAEANQEAEQVAESTEEVKTEEPVA